MSHFSSILSQDYNKKKHGQKFDIKNNTKRHLIIMTRRGI